MKARNIKLKLITLIALITIGTAWSAANAGAPIDLTRSTGTFGITQNQTARLSLANIDDGSFVPCIRVELAFVDVDGNILSQKVFEVDSGKSAFLDLKGIEVGTPDTRRSQIRAIVTFRDDPFFYGDPSYLDNGVAVLEVFDNKSGETRFTLPTVQKVQKVQKVR